MRRRVYRVLLMLALTAAVTLTAIPSAVFADDGDAAERQTVTEENKEKTDGVSRLTVTQKWSRDAGITFTNVTEEQRFNYHSDPQEPEEAKGSKTAAVTITITDRNDGDFRYEKTVDMVLPENTADSTETFTFDDFPGTADGDYVVTESAVDGWRVSGTSIRQNSDGSFDAEVTRESTDQMVDVNIESTWDGVHNYYPDGAASSVKLVFTNTETGEETAVKVKNGEKPTVSLAAGVYTVREEQDTEGDPENRLSTWTAVFRSETAYDEKSVDLTVNHTEKENVHIITCWCGSFANVNTCVYPINHSEIKQMYLTDDKNAMRYEEGIDPGDYDVRFYIYEDDAAAAGDGSDGVYDDYLQCAGLGELEPKASNMGDFSGSRSTNVYAKSYDTDRDGNAFKNGHAYSIVERVFRKDGGSGDRSVSDQIAIPWISSARSNIGENGQDSCTVINTAKASVPFSSYDINILFGDGSAKGTKTGENPNDPYADLPKSVGVTMLDAGTREELFSMQIEPYEDYDGTMVYKGSVSEEKYADIAAHDCCFSGQAIDGWKLDAEDGFVMPELDYANESRGIYHADLHYHPIGALAVTNRVINRTYHDGEKFPFELTFPGSGADGTYTAEIVKKDDSGKELSRRYQKIAVEDGRAEFSLADGETIRIPDLPYGIDYTVRETKHDGCTVRMISASGREKAGSDANRYSVGGRIRWKNTASVVFENTLKEKETEPSDVEPEKTVRSLTVASEIASRETAPAKKASVKKASGVSAASGIFKYRVTLSDRSISGTYGDMTFRDGVAEFSLKGGERLTAKSLPDGISYEVLESAHDGYTVSGDIDGTPFTGDLAKSTLASDDVVTFVNSAASSTSDDTKKHDETPTHPADGDETHPHNSRHDRTAHSGSVTKASTHHGSGQEGSEARTSAHRADGHGSFVRTGDTGELPISALMLIGAGAACIVLIRRRKSA